jgi:membrane AbrB-like protein
MTLLTSLAAALVGGFAFEKMHIPSGALIGAMVGVTVHNIAFRQAAALPAPVTFAAYVVLGWAIGFGVNRQSLASLRTAVLPIALVVVALLAFGGLLAVLLVRWGGYDPVTAYLSASPGALSQMTVLADQSGSNLLFVVTIHTVRVVAVLAVAPLVTRWLT